VAEFTHREFSTPAIMDNSFSSDFTLDPVVIHPEFKVSSTSSRTSLSMKGGEKEIFIL
jgi:hypothetical protein